MRSSTKLLLLGGLIFVILPLNAFAHGTEIEHQKETLVNTYIISGFTLLFLLFFAFYFYFKKKAHSLSNVKKKQERDNRVRFKKRASLFKWAWILSLLGVLISGGTMLLGNQQAKVELTHIHGLGYSANGSEILIPSHNGLATYNEGNWNKAPGESHDYMGFSTIDNGFYSSGHPAQGSKLSNPFGLVKSIDGGQKVDVLALHGEVDFHTLSASYFTHTIYVINPHPTSLTDDVGIYYTQDEGETWNRSKMDGLTGEVITLAVHPHNDAIVTAGTSDGLYISKDYGTTFEEIMRNIQITALAFDMGENLFVGGFDGKPSLTRLNTETFEKENISIPTLTDDAISYIAQNPVNEKEIVFSTFNRDVYLLESNTQSWTRIANQGMAEAKNDKINH